MKKTTPFLAALALILTTTMSFSQVVNVTLTNPTVPESNEGSGIYSSLRVSRTGSTASYLNVSYSITSTLSNADISGTVPPGGLWSISIGKSIASLGFQPLQDAITEGDESFTFTLLPGPGYTLGANTSVTYTVTDNVLSVDDVALNDAFSIYPNPTTDYFNIKGSIDFQSLKVYNAIGVQVLETDSSFVSLSKFAAGIYFARIETEKGHIVKRIIKK